MNLETFTWKYRKKIGNYLSLGMVVGALGLFVGGMDSTLWGGDIRDSYNKLKEMKECSCTKKVNELEERISYGKKRQKRGTYVFGIGIALSGISLLSLIGADIITDGETLR